MAEDVFEVQGVRLRVEKVTIDISGRVMRFLDEVLQGADFAGKGLMHISADLLEKLPELARIIFSGQPEAAAIDWLKVDTDTLIAIKECWEKKNPRTMRLLKDTLTPSVWGGLESVTAFLNVSGQMSSFGKPAEATHKPPTTSAATGATPS